MVEKYTIHFSHKQLIDETTVDTERVSRQNPEYNRKHAWSTITAKMATSFAKSTHTNLFFVHMPGFLPLLKSLH